MHFQDSTPRWLEAVQKLPQSFNIKTVDQANLLRDARAVRPGIGTTLRHWGPPQHHTGTWEERKQRARQYFATFIDNTFREQYARHVTVVQAYNEIWANSQDAAERASWTEQDRAFAVVWNTEYRTQADYRHIRLALSSAAVGNDLPRAIGELALEEDCYVTYHPYIAVYSPNAPAGAAMIDVAEIRAAFHHHQPENAPQTLPYQVAQNLGVNWAAAEAALVAPGQRSDGDWRWCSGRWHYMEQAWGLKPDWLFTEGGPCRDLSGSLTLDPLGGWRAIWGDGGAGEMLALMSAWLDDVRGTPAFREGRIGGVHLFTTPGSSPWQTFAFRQPELDDVATLIAAKWTAPEPPPDDDPPPEPRRYHRTVHLLPQDATMNEMDAVLRAAYPQRQTVLFSADDAFVKAPELTGRTVHVWEVERVAGSEQALRNWVNLHYPPWPATSQFRRIRDLFVADRWDSPVGTKEERAGAAMPPGDWVVSTAFNQRYQIVEGGAFHRHTGWDLNNQSPYWDSDRNMPVRACANGRVIHMVEFPDTSSWGKVIVTEHVLPDGQVVHSRHAHLAEFAEGLEAGHWVRRGALLGTTGRTNVPGGAYHHHWDISISGVLVDDPGHWCFDNATCVTQHYVNPGLFVQSRR